MGSLSSSALISGRTRECRAKAVLSTRQNQNKHRPPVFQPGQRPVPEALHLQGLSPGRLGEGAARSLLVSSPSPQLPKQTLNIGFQMEQKLKPLTWFSLSVPALASCQTPAWAPCESEPRGQLACLACAAPLPEAPPRSHSSFCWVVAVLRPSFWFSLCTSGNPLASAS